MDERPNWIEVGDMVSVEMNGGEWYLPSVQVQWKPNGPGDSWVFQEKDGTMIYISEGCTITKRPVDGYN